MPKVKKEKIKIIVVLGPTAVGKSDFAVKIAKKYNGEIISADSRQVFLGADILSGKITEKEKKGVPHYCLDVATFGKEYSVTKWKKEAEKAIKKIVKEKKIPIICGGTGMYIDALVNNQVFPKVKPNLKRRKELSLKNKEELFSLLLKLDKTRAENIDKNNPHRLMRSIEIAESLGFVPVIEKKESPFEFLFIGLNLPKEELQNRIKIRLEKRMKKGMMNDLKKLYSSGLSYEKIEKYGLEFKWLSRLAKKEIGREEALEKLYFDIIHYAKRQLTWFKRNKDIVWISPFDTEKVYVDTMLNFINKK
jgi:tRNA dimethylallyltransferase